jgi:hypothetical protein
VLVSGVQEAGFALVYVRPHVTVDPGMTFVAEQLQDKPSCGAGMFEPKASSHLHFDDVPGTVSWVRQMGSRVASQVPWPAPHGAALSQTAPLIEHLPWQVCTGQSVSTLHDAPVPEHRPPVHSRGQSASTAQPSPLKEQILQLGALQVPVPQSASRAHARPARAPPVQVLLGQLMSAAFCPQDRQAGSSMNPFASLSTQSMVTGFLKSTTV